MEKKRNKIVGIMQPYFMPYIGYWQLINAVDCFVLFDDVNYIKKGWINRNRIICNKNEYIFTLPLRSASQNRHICEHFFVDENGKTKLWNVVENSYKKSPEWATVKELLKEIILYETLDLVEYIRHSVEVMCEYMDIQTTIMRSKDLNNDKSLKAQDKIIDICELMGATVYVNPSGGVDLYDEDAFIRKGIDLRFIVPRLNEYKQLNDTFLPGLSLIDMLCMVHRDQIKEELDSYSLVPKTSMISK